MIEHLRITGFKRFKDQAFKLKALTVLAGMNGSGKTSVIHACLLMREAWRRTDGIVELNGPYGVELGSFGDVLNHDCTSHFEIELISEASGNLKFRFEQGDTDLYAKVLQEAGGDIRLAAYEARSFQYLSAERYGPRISQQSAALPSKMLEVGYRGQFTAQTLDILGKQIVPAARLYLSEAEEPPLLKSQTELWLSSITRPIQLDTETFGGTGISALKFRTGDDWIKPTNMGFGITYALPIIVAALSAPNDGLLIVENPEAHLHPAGQSQMGVFLASMAAAGIQLIVETHSDHILNGIRRAIGEKRTLPAHDAIVHFFDDQDTVAQELHFTDRGSISTWPSGFFDQYQLDVSALSKIRRSS